MRPPEGLLVPNAVIPPRQPMPESRQSEAAGCRKRGGIPAVVELCLCYNPLMDKPSLRPAHPRDFAFCERLYFAEMDHIITQLGLDMARQRESFVRQWEVTEIRIITTSGEDIGWLQTKMTDSALFLGQLYLSGHLQRQGIGTRVLQMLMEQARRAGKPIILGVVKINPARRLYERLGFRRTHEDEHKVYMRLENYQTGLRGTKLSHPYDACASGDG
jgi:GNAT superfamily N-acetyltransferase